MEPARSPVQPDPPLEPTYGTILRTVRIRARAYARIAYGHAPAPSLAPHNAWKEL